jgi:hypothetical protein
MLDDGLAVQMGTLRVGLKAIGTVYQKDEKLDVLMVAE